MGAARGRKWQNTANSGTTMHAVNPSTLNRRRWQPFPLALTIWTPLSDEDVFIFFTQHNGSVAVIGNMAVVGCG